MAKPEGAFRRWTPRFKPRIVADGIFVNGLGHEMSVRWGWISLGVAVVAAATALMVRHEPAAPPPPRTHDALIIGASQYSSNLNPNIDNQAVKQYVLAMTMRPLVAFDATWTLVCTLCTELPSAEHGTLVDESRPDGTPAIAATFTLPERVSWGDGTPLTSEDILFTWQVGKDPLTGFEASQLFTADIADITVTDARTFTIHFARHFCDISGLSDFHILPAHLERAPYSASPADYRNHSTYQTDPTNPGLYFGPYRITAMQTGASITLEPNSSWFGPPPFFRRITVRTIENTAAMSENLLSGAVDYVPGEVGITPDQVLAFQKRHPDDYVYIFKPSLHFEHLDLNLDNPILADVRVRQALLLGTDRALINDKMFSGTSMVADNVVSPLDSIYANDFRHYPFDPQQAASLLTTAGWTPGADGLRHNAVGAPLTLELMSTAGNRTREAEEQVLQSQWRSLGVTVRIINQPARVLFGDTLRQRKFTGAALFSWISGPQNIPRSTLSSTEIPSSNNSFAGQNFGGFKNAELDQVIRDLEVICDKATQKRLWTRLEHIYADELPELPLRYEPEAFILPHWLKGVKPTGHQFYSTLKVETWRAEGEPSP